MSTPRVYKSKFALRRAGRRLSMSESRASSPTPEAGAGAPTVPSSEDEIDLPARSTSKQAGSNKPASRGTKQSGGAHNVEDGDDAGASAREEVRIWKESYIDIRVPVPDDDDDDDTPPPVPRRTRSVSRGRAHTPRTRSMSRGRRSTPARGRNASPSPEIPLLDSTSARKRARSSTARIESGPSNVGPPVRRGRSASRAAAAAADLFPIMLPGQGTKVGPPRGVPKTSTARALPPRSKSLGRLPSAHAPTRTALPSTHPATRVRTRAASGSTATTFHPNFSPGDITGPPVVPLKRPRGRPRKMSPAHPTPVQPRSHPMPAPDVPAPKRRGRPPGSKNRRKSEGDRPSATTTGGRVRSIVDALERRQPGAEGSKSAGAASARSGEMYVRVPPAPYALHTQARRLEEDHDERELPIALYDDDDKNLESIGVRVPTGNTRDSDEEVERVLNPRSAPSPQRGRPTKEKGKARLAEDELALPPAKRRRTASTARKSVPQATQSPSVLVPATAAMSISATTPVRPVVRQPCNVGAAPSSSGRGAPAPATLVYPPSSPASMFLGRREVPFYSSRDEMYNTLAEEVEQWRVTQTGFDFQAAWAIQVPAGQLLDEKLVRKAGREVTNTIGMPFRCVAPSLVYAWLTGGSVRIETRSRSCSAGCMLQFTLDVPAWQNRAER